ncbi:MAG: hypothetical protein KDA45_03600 [Planctomycetales bacterium]|nr:hypothetical protein [Planctomycetales bacterium]
MFEFKLLLINVLLPSAVILLAVLAAWGGAPRAVSRREAVDAASLPGEPTAGDRSRGLQGVQRGTATLMTVAAVVAFALAFGLRTEFVLWPEDAWMRLSLGVTVVGVAAILAVWIPWSPLAWAVRLLAVGLATYGMIPRGEAWEFLLPSENYWLAAMWLSVSVGWWSIVRRSPAQAAVLGLAWIPSVAAAAFLTAQSFLKVTEPLLAVASILGWLSLFSWPRWSGALANAAAGPCLFALAAAVASAQFNSYLGLPDSLSWLAMSCPAIVGLLGLPWTSRGTAGHAAKSYVLLSVLSSLLLAAVVVGWTWKATAV